jgi:Pirin
MPERRRALAAPSTASNLKVLPEKNMSIRPVKRVIKSKPTLEGAGVHLRRAFGFGNTSDFDPFLLLDDFRNDVPEDYLAGFPWHPHRGIETITYVLAGTVEHGDSMGNRGSIASGDLQWMTAGSGEGRSCRPHARLPIVGQSSFVAQNDPAALSGSESS